MAEYSKTYARINWENEPSKKTALSATNLNKMDLALNTVDDRLIELNTIKAEQSTVNNLVKEIIFEQEMGIFKIIKQDGSETTYDTKLEKIAINFEYDSLNQKLIITLEDGTKQEVDMKSLVSEYEFFDTETIGFIKQEDGSISANIKEGSVTEEKLQPNYLAEIKQEVNNSLQYAQIAKENSGLAERWAVGRADVPESATDNSKYFAEQAKKFAEQAENIAGIGIATEEKVGIVKPDGDTITVDEDGTIHGATKVDIATPDKVGVVKPNNDFTIGEDGTLGINTMFETIAERANIESGDTWKTVLGKINKYFGDIKPHAFLDKITEEYIDSVITEKVNNAIQKSRIIDNFTTQIKGFIPDATLVTDLNDRLVEQNNNLGNYWCLNGGSYIPPNTDLDNIKEIGSYFSPNDIESTTILKNPVNTAFTMQVYASNGQASHYITQELRGIYLDGGIFIRKFDLYANTWTVWEKLLAERDLIAKQYPATLLNGWTQPFGDNHLITYKIGNLYMLSGIILSPSVITEDTYNVANLNLPFNFTGQGFVNMAVQTDNKLYLTSYNDGILHDQYRQVVANTEYMIKGFFIH